MTQQYISINAIRLQGFIDQFAEIGATPKGGVTRLALTDGDKKARDLFIRMAKDTGCTIKIDAMGNIFARRAGRYADLPALLTGSHGDSQPLGGRFDGIYGVLAGLEALYSLNDANIETDRPIDLVMWTNEEGARFAPAMIGSAVFCNVTSLEDGWNCRDVDNLSMKEELERIGYLGQDDFSDYSIYAAVEIHIEQGPILENTGINIGIVTSALGQRWFEVSFTGAAGHAGTTPMNLRQDALLGLAKAVEAVNEIGQAEKPDGRATVGKISISPNSRNVIPGDSWLSIEFRHPSAVTLEAMSEKLHQQIETIAANLNLEFSIKPVLTLAPILFDEKCADILRETANNLGYLTQDMSSGAGHDACNLNKIAPTAMIFIPCIDGLSHNEAENIKPEWSVDGANVLVNSLVKLATKNALD